MRRKTDFEFKQEVKKLVDDEYTTPQKLLETNKYFDEFRF